MSETQEPTSEDSSLQGEDLRHWQAWKDLTIDAYGRFHDALEAIRPNHPGHTPYSAVDRVQHANGTFAWNWGADGETREAINAINAWGGRLHQWAAWNRVVSGYDDENVRWEVLNHFVEPVAYFCMLQPSSFSDCLALAAETLLHQANRRTSPHEPDRLDQDARPGRHLRRSDRHNQLDRLGKRWTLFGPFRDALHALNSDEYKRSTSNFRDLASHSFSPHLMLGHVSRAIRGIEPWTELQQQEDGTYIRVEHPTQMAISYSFMSWTPLDLDDAHRANLSEYRLARRAMNRLFELVDELCDAIDQMPTSDTQAIG